MSYDLISIGAHPDDVEVGSGGVLIKLSRAGRRVGIIYLTAGEKGTGGDPFLRSSEASQAAAKMGADILKTYDWGDAALFDTHERRLLLAADIRRYAPQIILCPAPWIGHGRRQSHPDHVACGQIVVNAAQLAALSKADLNGPAYQVRRIFHYFLPPGMLPDFVVDISDCFESWIEALKCHRSQFLNPAKSRDYIEILESLARHYGLMAGVKYAQGFKADQTLLIQDIFDLAKGDRF